MSLFQTIENPCPTCGVPVEFDIVHSVNVDRRPVLRSQILDRTFQEETCPSCATKFRTEPEFTYLHAGAKQFLSVWPAGNRGQWADWERRSVATFNKFYGPGAIPAAAAIGRELNVRVVFGWEAAREKIVAAEAGIDDHGLELAKMLLMRAPDGPPPDEETELRLLGIDGEQNMILGEVETATAALRNVFTVPRALLDEIAAAPDDWHELSEQLNTGPFVDVARLMIDPEPALAA